MLFWVLGFFILLIVAMVPILSIVLDSPAFRRMIEAKQDTSKMDEIMSRLHSVEDEVASLEKGVEGLREENKFLQRMLENPERPRAPRLEPPKE